jgi:pimeloyl-ACP methyl ester carboxylesterase
MSETNCCLETSVIVESFDGLRLSGSQCVVVGAVATAVLLHGAGADRHEDGFFDRLAPILWSNNITTLRVDLRAHGNSEGTRQSITLTGILNDIVAIVSEARSISSCSCHLIAASFSGGLAAFYAATRDIRSLTLINPVLDYKLRLLGGKAYWVGDHLTAEGLSELRERGYLDHLGVFGISSCLLNELPWIDPLSIAERLQCPTLVLHGNADHKVPYSISKGFVERLQRGKMITFEGADHELVWPGDEGHRLEKTTVWHETALKQIADWILEQSTSGG